MLEIYLSLCSFYVYIQCRKILINMILQQQIMILQDKMQVN